MSIRTFGEWVAALDEGKKGVVPDFISDKLKGKKKKDSDDGKEKDADGNEWEETDDTEDKAGKNKKWHNDGVAKGHRPKVDKGAKEKDKGQKTGEGKRQKE